MGLGGKGELLAKRARAIVYEEKRERGKMENSKRMGN
jgi:hypothetical protein